MESDPAPKKILKFMEKPGKVVCRGEEKGDRIEKALVPLTSRTFQKTASIEELSFRVVTGSLITDEKV